MVRREIVVLEDDIDGGKAEHTVYFGVDGALYEIDLNASNDQLLRGKLDVWVKHARRVGKIGGVSRVVNTGPAKAKVHVQDTDGRVPAQPDREQRRAIREWARRKGYQVGDKGVIAQWIVDGYHAEAGRGAAPAAANGAGVAPVLAFRA